MSKKYLFPIICLVFVASLCLGTLADAENADFAVGRFVIAAGIEAREPVGITDSFPSSTRKVYSFLEARDIREDTGVAMVWFLGDEEMALVTLTLRKGSRWRTYSSKLIAGRSGLWRVELQDEEGNVVQTATFTIE